MHSSIIGLALMLFSWSTYAQVVTQDSLALIDLHNNCNGSSWTLTTPWNFNTPVHTWEGISIQNNRVTAISLNSKGLTSALPNSLNNLTELKLLGLNHNNITTLPDSITNWTKLQSLSFSSNNISNLPSDIGLLSNLQLLDASNNNLSSLPNSIGNLNLLEVLLLKNNSISSLPNSFSNLSALKTLHFSSSVLTTIPSQVTNLPNLEELHCSGGNLQTINNNISNLTKLKILNLNYNALTTVPSALGQLITLEELHLNNNALTTLPPSIGQLKQLKELHLNQNLLTTIPDTIGTLTALRYLYLSKNELDSLPEALSNLVLLSYLVVDQNKLQSLPIGLANNFYYTTIIAFENRLEFDDIEPYLTAQTPSIAYDNQDSVGNELTTAAAINSSYTMSVAVGGSQNNYQWFFNHIYPIPGATSDQYTIPNVTQADIGLYHCKITSDSVPNLTLYSRPITLSITSNTTAVNNEENIKVFPSITNDYCTLTAQWNLPQSGDYTLYSINGQQLLQQSFKDVQQLQATIDLSQYPSGTYVLRLNSDQQQISKRIVKQ